VASQAPPGERGILVAVALATALAPLNSTMLIVALPRIIDDLGTRLGTAGWLVTGYLIAVAALQTPAGKLGDRYGHRRLFLGGLSAFLVSSLGAAVAPSIWPLIAFRVGQGVTGAIVFPNGWALLREVVPAERRASRFGLVGSSIGLAAAIGPQIGELALDLAGWRFIFLVNVAMVVPALIIGQRCLPRRAERPRPTGAFDVVGTAGWLALLLGAVVVLNTSVRSGRAAIAVVGVPLLVAAGVWFVRRELCHPDPVLQPRFFAHPAFAAATGGMALSNLSMYVTLLALPIMLDDRAVSVGTVLTVMTGLSVALAPVGGRLADRLGRRRPAVLGIGLMAAGLAPLALAGRDIAIPLLVGELAIIGVGLGLSSAAMQTAALEAIDPREAGVASGVYATGRYIGSILGSSLLAATADPAGDATFVGVFVAGILATIVVTRIPSGAGAVTPHPSGLDRAAAVTPD